MFVTLKILHLLALIVGGTASIVTLGIQRFLAKSGLKGPPPKPIANIMRLLGLSGLGAIAVLWLTGLVMLVQNYSGADLGIWFSIKLIAATLIFGISAFMNFATARARKGGPPANLPLMKALGNAIRILLLLAIITAVITFTN